MNPRAHPVDRREFDWVLTDRAERGQVRSDGLDQRARRGLIRDLAGRGNTQSRIAVLLHTSTATVRGALTEAGVSR